jgi:TRAP transporter TAXI family solute receptor
MPHHLRCASPKPVFFSWAMATILLAAANLLSAQGSRQYTVASGSQGASFYPVARALCRQVERMELEFTCEAVPTPGSMYNLRALNEGTHDLALSQQHLQYLAWRGSPPFDREYSALRTIAPLYREVFVLAATPESGIETLDDLPGKRVNIGNAGSGTRLVIEELFEHLNWKLSDFMIYSHRSGELPDLLCNRQIDGAIYSTGHPNVIYHRLVDECGVGLIDLWNDQIAAFVAKDQAYAPATIPSGTYRLLDKDIKGFGMQIILSVHRDLPPAHVEQLLRVLVSERNTLQEEAPVYRTIDTIDYPLQQIAPYHEGVRLFHRESKGN